MATLYTRYTAELNASLDRAHAQGDTVGGTEQVGEHRDAIPRGVLEQQRGALLAKDAVGHSGHFEVRGHRCCYTAELPKTLQIGCEVAQITVFHNLWL